MGLADREPVAEEAQAAHSGLESFIALLLESETGADPRRAARAASGAVREAQAPAGYKLRAGMRYAFYSNVFDSPRAEFGSVYTLTHPRLDCAGGYPAWWTSSSSTSFPSWDLESNILDPTLCCLIFDPDWEPEP